MTMSSTPDSTARPGPQVYSERRVAAGHRQLPADRHLAQRPTHQQVCGPLEPESAEVERVSLRCHGRYSAAATRPCAS